MHMAARVIEILLMEDDSADVELTRQGLHQAKIANSLHVVKHGGQAISFLRREGQFVNAPCPHLIFLDLRMPIMGGRRVLEEIKNDDRLREIPVIVFSSVDCPEEAEHAGRSGAHAFVRKPVDFRLFVERVRHTIEFLLDNGELPVRERVAEQARPGIDAHP
jgi:CheY-like chemotaxis protein